VVFFAVLGVRTVKRTRMVRKNFILGAMGWCGSCGGGEVMFEIRDASFFDLYFGVTDVK
jgi:hypothetical protein